MSYTPLDADFLTSTLLKEGPDVVSVFALIMASTNKLGESGMEASIAASLLRISDERAEAAFKILAAPDPRSRNRAHDGRRILPRENGRWFLVSHEKYQWLASRAAATESNRRYEARKKERERSGNASAATCDESGCGLLGEVAAGGRMTCSAHAMPVDREPGEEG